MDQLTADQTRLMIQVNFKVTYVSDVNDKCHWTQPNPNECHVSSGLMDQRTADQTNDPGKLQGNICI